MSKDQSRQHQTYLRVTEANLLEIDFMMKIEGRAGGMINSKGRLEVDSGGPPSKELPMSSNE